MVGIILVGVDDSQTALRAAERAAMLALAFGAELQIVSASNVNMTKTFEAVKEEDDPEAMSHAYRELLTQSAQRAENIAAGVAEILRRNFPNLKVSSKAAAGAPGVAILNESRRIDADIIVVGNRRVQGPARILGSIARTIAAETTCDLYVVNTHPR